MNPPEAWLTESWNTTLHKIPTVLGRLAWLASLRNANTGTYEHFGLAQRTGTEVVHQLVRASHMDTFQEWLGFPLQQQKEEVEQYFEGLEEDRTEALASWLSLPPYGGWIPPESRDVERMLFLNDLELILELVRAEYGVAVRDPDS